MLTDRHFPYSSMQEINLDWILTKVKNILRFVPDDGAVGQILRRTAHGAEWSNEQGGGGAVDSVNGQTGTVVLTSTDIGLGNVDNVQQYSASNPPPYPVTSVNGQTGDVIVSGGAVDSVNGQTGTVVLGKSDIGLGNVDNVQQYSASNPPPYPVTSVNTQTGNVVLSIPTDTSDLTNNAGFVDAAGAASAAPVQSVNGQTGAVSIDNYSSNEIDTGKKWIDGKTIYRKVKVVTSNIPAGAYTIASDIPIGTIEQMVTMYGVGLNNQNWFPLHYPFSTSNLGYFYFGGATSNIIGNMPFASSKTIFVFEYTKT